MRTSFSLFIFSGVHLDKPTKEKWCEAELEAALCMAVERGSFEIYKALVDTGVPPPDMLFYEARFLNRVDVVRDLLAVKFHTLVIHVLFMLPEGQEYSLSVRPFICLSIQSHFSITPGTNWMKLCISHW